MRLHKDDPALYICQTHQHRWNCLKQWLSWLHFLVIAFLKGFIGFIRGRLMWDGWCLTSVIAEGRLVLCRSIDPKPTRTWSLNTLLLSCWIGLQMIDIFWQAPKILGILGCFGWWLVTHPRYMRCFYLLTPMVSITCRWVAVRSAGLPIAIVC